jgi:flagellar hook assembly protein FlgD
VPNPFNPRTVLEGRLQAAGEVVLRIHDARGRVVRTLWTGTAAAGAHRWHWDGRDGDGRPCATGIYLARLRAAGRTVAVAKLTLVR